MLRVVTPVRKAFKNGGVAKICSVPVKDQIWFHGIMFCKWAILPPVIFNCSTCGRCSFAVSCEGALCLHFLQPLSIMYVRFNPLTPNDPYMGRTAPLTSKRCILYIYSTNIGTEYFKRGIYSPFYSLQIAVRL